MTAPAGLPVGVVGLGLMGRSIAACLTAAGHPVTGIEADAARRDGAAAAVARMHGELADEGLLAEPAAATARFTAAAEPAALAGAALAIEAVSEDLAAKQAVFATLEAVLAPAAIIASNTSAIPITLLQQGMAHPGRLIGMHWAEPAHLTRFLEIIAGEHTDPAVGPRLHALARGWGKEPSLVRRDIRGFIANRIMYAMIREAFHLVETGVATVEDVDRSVRNDIGSWATLAGPFRWMDLTGIPAYAAVMRDLLPELCNDTDLPALMRRTVAAGAQGTANAQGFHPYTAESAAAWDAAFQRFSIDIRRLQQEYPDTPGPDGGTSPRPQPAGEEP